MPFNTIALAQQDGVATLTFDRPDKRNAISYELIDELLVAIDQVSASDAQVLIFTGAGRAFCSGMDLDSLKAITSRTEAENMRDSLMMAHLFRSIYEFARPTIAAVNGPAVAGGCGIATLCDFTVASTEAKFGYTEVRIGFLPAIVSTFLVRQVGEKCARDLLLTGRIIAADEAHRLGLATEVVEPGRLLDRCHEIARMLMENSPASLGATKRLLNAFAQSELDEQIQLAVKENAAIRTTQDFREGVTSFLEKRKPHWTGR